jgi:uncharacterized protein YjbI with pentapeptide repeats/class 3 adenylate cyclase
MTRNDILATLKKGAREWNSRRKSDPDFVPKLDGLELVDLDLSNFDFSDLSMHRITINHCSLRSAKLISTDLRDSDLKNNDFTKASMIATRLENANLSGSKIAGANLLTAAMRCACLQTIDFRGHDLSSLDFRGADLRGANLEGQNFVGHDLSGANLADSILNNVDFTNANLTNADVSNSQFAGATLKGSNFRSANLNNVNLASHDLSGINFEGARLTHCNLSDANLKKARLARADITGSILGEIRTDGWDISQIRCEHAFWGKNRTEKTFYRLHEFERIYAENILIKLDYPYRLTAGEITTLPILIEHLEATYWGAILRLKSIKDVPGGSMVELSVEESSKYQPSVLKSELQQEANRIHTAQLALRFNQQLKDDLKEELAILKEKFWPRLLELASEHEMEQVRNLTVLFMDLKGFSKWRDDELSEKLGLFRGLIKPILNKWRASYPNMEGDSLRATFRNATAGLACACMMRDVLMAAGFELRIGVELGEVSVVHNEVTDQSDLEGTAVSMAARLEATAKTGFVLASEKVRHYTHHKGIFRFAAERAKLAKSIGTRNAGDIIECYSVTLLKPVQEIA